MAAHQMTQREEYLKSLNSFIESSSDVINRFTKFPETSETGMETLGYNSFSEEPLLPSASIPSPSADFALTIDADKQRELLIPYKKIAGPDTRQPPSCAGELTACFSKEERLAMYEYTLQSAARVATPPEILPMETYKSVDNQPKELSELELMKAVRDFKRRRQAYRTKVSTKNKSQTQVTREIIHNMMVFLGAEETEPENLHPKEDSVVPANLPENGCSERSNQERKKITSASGPLDEKQYNRTGISGGRDKRDSDRDYETKVRWREKREDDSSSRYKQKHERDYETDSHRKNQMERQVEYEKDMKRSKRESESRRKYDEEYYQARDKRGRESKERYRERKHSTKTLYKYKDHRQKRKDTDDQIYERFEDENKSNNRRKDNAEISPTILSKLEDGKDVGKEENSWDTGLEASVKESCAEDGEISSHESDITCSNKDSKYSPSSRHRKKSKLKKEKSKRKQRKKRKHKTHRHSHSDSEESVSDDSKFRKKSTTDIYSHEESIV
ncbi:U11/U12 small nuclear ribonucleoprotein 48 kDa protein-like [Homarus americanus]|uniref:U11/U12 small nuclear ribonucleoprotein 48 kDa protein-like n=1 Tax=Homarus americanus TaxID=6706 RepID=A0A8J5NAF8_HOMAM|nr:U11/U12 small nuclear ribonucleoprotein 48 kDa protein-like [Homarus americanus]